MKERAKLENMINWRVITDESQDTDVPKYNDYFLVDLIPNNERVYAKN